MRRYIATMYGHQIARAPTIETGTITEARRWAESYGSTADECTIATARGVIVALHVRDTAGNGLRWFRATP